MLDRKEDFSIMSDIYSALTDVLGIPPVIIGANDYAPLITAVCASLCVCIVICNVFALIRSIFK